jgi:TatD-related deoxyribonuclease
MRRPGAVLAPKSVPKLTKKLMEENLLSEQQVHRIHVENPQNTYNIELKE